MRNFFLGWIVLLLVIAGCKPQTARDTGRVTLHIRTGFGWKYEIRRLGFNDDKEVIIDSGKIKSASDSIVVTLHDTDYRAYRLHVEGRPITITFVNDTKDVHLFYNLGGDVYHFENSPANAAFQRFTEEQVAIATSARAFHQQAEDLLKTRPAEAKTAMHQRDSLNRLLNSRNKAFADTVSNPAIFMIAYNSVEYGRDYNGLKQFMQRSAARFPAYQPIQMLAKANMEFLKIYEEEFQVGDVLPEVILPDENGRFRSTYQMKGKYALINFWSTWCDHCYPFSMAEKELIRKTDTSRFAIVSIAIDAEKKNWQDVVRAEQFAWPQLIDEKMWDGAAVKTLKFDSIPFNFLVDPKGRVVAKAIRADSLLQTVHRFVK